MEPDTDACDEMRLLIVVHALFCFYIIHMYIKKKQLSATYINKPSSLFTFQNHSAAHQLNSYSMLCGLMGVCAV